LTVRVISLSETQKFADFVKMHMAESNMSFS
jgi:hypothetical protein